MRAERLRALWWVALLWSCSDGLQARPPLDCDPSSGAGCAAGEHCRLIAGGGLACLSQDPAEAPCRPGSCPPGAACLEVEGLLTCRPVCALARPDRGCGEGACVIAVGDGPWGVCAEPCGLETDCGAGGTCAPVPGLRFPLCVAEGPGQAGDSCAVQRCGAGLGCLSAGAQGPSCVRVCEPDGVPCPAGRCEGPIPEVDGVLYCVAPG